MSSSRIIVASLVVLAACTSTPPPMPCGPGLARCGTQCADLTTDPTHCGSCITQCRGVEVCEEGECVCPSGLTSCEGLCVEIGTATHCSGCGDRCAPEERLCAEGMCTECGATGEQCCESMTCQRADAACVDGNCVPCGLADQPCCDGMCEGALECSIDGVCGECGGLLQTCCALGDCDNPIATICGGGICDVRDCEGFAATGFAEPSPGSGHCSSETIPCVNTAPSAGSCLLFDETPSFDGYDCAECALHQWLQCSYEDGCADEAAALLCCIQDECDPPRWACAACSAQDRALAACNQRNSRACDRIFVGSAVGSCF